MSKLIVSWKLKIYNWLFSRLANATLSWEQVKVVCIRIFKMIDKRTDDRWNYLMQIIYNKIIKCSSTLLQVLTNYSILVGFYVGRTDVNVIWRLCNFTCGVRPQATLCALFQAGKGTWVQSPKVRKLDG